MTQLDDMGIKSSTGTIFSISVLKRMIRNEKYKGVLVGGKTHKDFYTKKTTFTDEDEWVEIPDVYKRQVAGCEYDIHTFPPLFYFAVSSQTPLLFFQSGFVNEINHWRLGTKAVSYTHLLFILVRVRSIRH